MAADSRQALNNVIWNCLSGPQANFAAGTGNARRYARGFSPLVGFADPERPDFAALRPFCGADEHFYCDIWSGPAAAGWQIEHESSMFKMVWEGPATGRDAPDEPAAIALTKEHAARALELATLTNPGPFGLRTIELGEYFGDGERLIAMAGERMAAGSFRESQWYLHPPGIPRVRAGATVNPRADPQPTRTGSDPVSARDERQHRRPEALRKNRLQGLS